LSELCSVLCSLSGRCSCSSCAIDVLADGLL
jgi:hypothetical protein